MKYIYTITLIPKGKPTENKSFLNCKIAKKVLNQYLRLHEHNNIVKDFDDTLRQYNYQKIYNVYDKSWIFICKIIYHKNEFYSDKCAEKLLNSFVVRDIIE